MSTKITDAISAVRIALLELEVAIKSAEDVKDGCAIRNLKYRIPEYETIIRELRRIEEYTLQPKYKKYFSKEC